MEVSNGDGVAPVTTGETQPQPSRVHPRHGYPNRCVGGARERPQLRRVDSQIARKEENDPAVNPFAHGGVDP